MARAGPSEAIRPGDVFNPHGMFVGAFIPNCIMQYKDLSPTAKLTWARLQQYDGGKGECYPAYDTIGEELGISTRQAQRAVQELVDKAFLKRTTPSLVDRRGRKATCRYQFLWHECFGGAKKRDGDHSQSHDIYVVCKEESYGRYVVCTHDKSVPVSYDRYVANHTTDMSYKDYSLKQQRENTTTTTPRPDSPQCETGSCGGSGVSLSGKDETALTDEVLQYIDLKVEHQEEHSGFRKSKSAYKRSLLSLAKAGKLEMDDLDDLQKWNAAKSKADPYAKFNDLENTNSMKNADEEAEQIKMITNAIHIDAMTKTDGNSEALIDYIGTMITMPEDSTVLRVDTDNAVLVVTPPTALRLLEKLFPDEYRKANSQAIKETIAAWKGAKGNSQS